jgi:hypothetical protein
LQQLSLEAKDLLEEGRRHASERGKAMEHINELRRLNESAEGVMRGAARDVDLMRVREQVQQ